MLLAPCPHDESRRQQALDDLELLDTPAESYFDTLVRLTHELFQVDSALISLIDRDRQWFKARVGMDVAESPRDISFCGHTVAARSMLLVEDARQDQRFSDNPMVTAGPRIRFYAGQPLFSRDQQPIGTLCILHPQPRTFSPQEQLHLRNLATLVEDYLHLRSLSRQVRQAVSREQRKALIDPLTQLWNRAGFNQFFPREYANAREKNQQFALIYCDLDRFKQVNDQFGHGGGDQVLQESTRRMSAVLRPDDLLTRLGGEEFVAMVSVHDANELHAIAERMRMAIAASPISIGTQQHSVTASMGTAIAGPDESQAALLDRADSALYQAKNQGRNRTIHAH